MYVGAAVVPIVQESSAMLSGTMVQRLRLEYCTSYHHPREWASMALHCVDNDNRQVEQIMKSVDSTSASVVSIIKMKKKRQEEGQEGSQMRQDRNGLNTKTENIKKKKPFPSIHIASHVRDP